MSRRHARPTHRTLGRVALAVALATAGTMGVASAASALGGCEVSRKRDGTLRISAKKVSGTLRFGTSPEVIEGRFVNEDRCIDGGKARKCVVAEKGTVERTTPPPLCQYFLEDDEDSCTAKLSGCTPAMRPTCPPDMERMGSTCIERSNGQGTFGEAVSECVDRGRNLCTQSELMACDSVNLSNARPYSCGWFTDGGGWLFALESASEDDQSVFSRITIYRDDNLVRENPTSLGSIHNYFCCAPLGTP
jgi:hypothetical protein